MDLRMHVCKHKNGVINISSGTSKVRTASLHTYILFENPKEDNLLTKDKEPAFQ